MDRGITFGLVAALAVTVAVVAIGSLGPTRNPVFAGSAAVAGALAVSTDLVLHGTPEQAALTAAEASMGEPRPLHARVVFRFPPPNDSEVRVRVEGPGGFCGVWAATRRPGGWYSLGGGNSRLC